MFGLVVAALLLGPVQSGSASSHGGTLQLTEGTSWLNWEGVLDTPIDPTNDPAACTGAWPACRTADQNGNGIVDRGGPGDESTSGDPDTDDPQACARMHTDPNNLNTRSGKPSSFEMAFQGQLQFGGTAGTVNDVFQVKVEYDPAEVFVYNGPNFLFGASTLAGAFNETNSTGTGCKLSARSTQASPTVHVYLTEFRGTATGFSCTSKPRGAIWRHDADVDLSFTTNFSCTTGNGTPVAVSRMVFDLDIVNSGVGTPPNNNPIPVCDTTIKPASCVLTPTDSKVTVST